MASIDASNELKVRYMDHLRSTPEGKALMANSVRAMRMLRGSHADGGDHMCTKWVKTKTVEQLCQLIGEDLVACPQKIEIAPELFPFMCHENARLVQLFGFGERVLGYNIMGCECGRFISGELHSCNRTQGHLVDYTRDMGGETSKWFVPLAVSPMKARHLIAAGLDYVEFGRHQCTCGFRGAPHPGHPPKPLADAIAELRHWHGVRLVFV